MGYRIRQIESETKFNELLSIETLTRVVPLETIQAIVQDCGVADRTVLHRDESAE